MKKVLSSLIPLWVALGVLLVWWIVSLFIGVELIMPTPWVTLKETFRLFSSGDFWLGLGNTLLRSLVAFAFSFVIALSLAVLSSLSTVFSKAAGGILAVVRSIPTMSVILLLLIWTKPTGAPVFVAAIVICPTLYSAFCGAIGSVDPKLKEMCKLYRVSKKEQIVKLYLPSMAEGMFEGTASGLSLNLKLVIAAEALALTKNSVGGMMQSAKVWLETGQLMALTLVAVLLGVFAEWIVRSVGKAVMKWK